MNTGYKQRKQEIIRLQINNTYLVHNYGLVERDIVN